MASRAILRQRSACHFRIQKVIVSRSSSRLHPEVVSRVKNEELILVTGATGFLGARLVRELLDRQPDAKLALLIRSTASQSGRQRADSIVPADQRPRVEVFSGDVSQPNCGLDAAAWQRLSAETTRVIHSAATVRFDHSLDEARRINVEGTRRILDFAAGARQLRSLAYVGTAYVAGERADLVREDELAVGQGYRNTYEQTKAEAEALVRSRLGSLPGVILRPSIIVGDSRTGVTSSFKMMYWPLKIYARRLWRTVPGYPDAVLDIVPVDFVAASVARLAFDEAALGSTVHLCAGPRGSATIQQIAAARSGVLQRARSRATSIRNSSSPLMRPLLFLIVMGTQAPRAARRPRLPRLLHHAHAVRHHQRRAPARARRRVPAAGARLSRPPLPLLRRQRMGPQAGSSRNEHLRALSTLARPQRHRRQSGRRAGAAQRGLRSLGRRRRPLLVSPSCTPTSAPSTPFSAARSRCARASPSPSIAPTTGDAFTGSWPSSAPGASRFRSIRMLSLAEVRRILADSGTEILVTDKAVFERNIQDRQALNVRTWIQADDEHETLDGFRARRPTPARPFPPAAIDPAATVAVFHTSGTSGFPKGAALSSRALLGARASTVLAGLFLGPKDLALIALPWSHIMAVSIALYGLMAGIRGCFLDRFDVARALDLVERFGVTAVVGVPAMFARLVNSNPDPARLASVRLWLSASDHLPSEVRRAPAPVRRPAPAARRPAHSAGAAQRLRHGGTGRPGHDGHRSVLAARQRRPVLSRAAISHSRGR